MRSLCAMPMLSGILCVALSSSHPRPGCGSVWSTPHWHGWQSDLMGGSVSEGWGRLDTWSLTCSLPHDNIAIFVTTCDLCSITGNGSEWYDTTSLYYTVTAITTSSTLLSGAKLHNIVLLMWYLWPSFSVHSQSHFIHCRETQRCLRRRRTV